MREPLPVGPMSVEEYLAFEEETELRHEYVAGHVYAMSGATLRHNVIVGNVYAGLRAGGRGGPCRAFVEAVKVRVGRDRIYYPDVMIACGAQDESSVLAVDPCLVVEVVSPSTGRIDHGEKRDAYAMVPSLRAYLIVEQDRRLVTVLRRDGPTEWRSAIVTDAHGGGQIALPCPPVTLTLDEIYDGTEVPPAPALRVREAIAAEG